MRILVTGATGAIGIPLVEELLRRGHAVTMLCRPRKESDFHAFDFRLSRADILIGDVTQPRCGVENPNHKFDVIIHAAGKVQYHEHLREETLRTNVDGTRNVLDLAAFLNVKRFVDISTCYVAGRQDRLYEDEVGRETNAHNPYELSKIRAEALVRTFRGSHLILRLGTVIGNAEDGAIVNVGGYAGFTSFFWKFQDNVRAFQDNPFLVSLNPHTTLNLVTNEWVTKTIVDAAFSDMSGNIHLAHPNPVNMGWLFRKTFRGNWKFPLSYRPDVVNETALPSDLNWPKWQRRISAHVDYFGPYVRRDTVFAHRRVQHVPNYAPPPEITDEVIHRQVHYMDQVLFAKERTPAVAAE